MAVTLLLGQELLDRCEDDTSGLYPELLPQVSSTLCLNRWLPEQVLAAREGAKQLVVEVVAVGEHDKGRVFHCGFADHAAGVKGHGQALARALRVPAHANAPVARYPALRAADLVLTRRFRHPSYLRP